MAHAQSDLHFSRLLRGEILSHWEQLTAADIEEGGVDRSRLVNVVQNRYGFAKRRAEKEVDLFLGEFERRLRMAA